MKYFLDTEFLEGKQDKRFIGIKYGETKPTIDLISIGIVSDDGREYYAVSKDFNLKEAWNRYDEEELSVKLPGISHKKVYWIRDNVLKPIWKECLIRSEDEWYSYASEGEYTLFLEAVQNGQYDKYFTYKNFKEILKRQGKSNKEIVEDVFRFCTQDTLSMQAAKYYEVKYPPIEFYTYYGDYDWVTFCWLFGRMIDLPIGFPMYSRDLKQIMDDKEKSLENEDGFLELLSEEIEPGLRMCAQFDSIKEIPSYPTQENEHNSLSDARWNKKLYEFLNTI